MLRALSAISEPSQAASAPRHHSQITDTACNLLLQFFPKHIELLTLFPNPKHTGIAKS